MATKQARGTKRTCQSSECGARFYDLGRNPITCPICGSIYELASSPLSAAAEEKPGRRGRKAEYVEKAPVVAAVEPEADEVLPEIEEDGEAVAAADEDETFLEEEEEEGGDVSNIIGGPVAEGDEER
ncbi:MAG: TIGR02300 family protein [Hyphomicrobium sp.]|uniref:TIGR02300 family protein n=1 Tax=Hyphomicrobium sp. TaxID=82 RepID=UPI003D0E6DA2